MQFQSKFSIWTQHCGDISLNSKFTLSQIDSGIDGGRFIPADVIHTSDTTNSTNPIPIVSILNVYGRTSTTSQQKAAFFTELLSNSNIATYTANPATKMLIPGDFNCSYKNKRSDGSIAGTTETWMSLLDSNFINCFADEKSTITWKSGNNSSTIDYIFCSSSCFNLS